MSYLLHYTRKSTELEEITTFRKKEDLLEFLKDNYPTITVCHLFRGKEVPVTVRVQTEVKIGD